ncbi:Translin-associated protein X [Golovinomyces cichoracearum]|uniref:Translin-associated protein X n=1 Tax=Golovinomyces cichoracearum TaxID=62708 RepID=A0A420IYQ3_9PEZI|nr:Translin-associated protein X [Golovinomyces cichoracearum]
MKRKLDQEFEMENTSVLVPIFERFRDQLDEHYDRRERIIKVSRDVTSVSKKIIFALQRVRATNGEIPPKIASEIQEKKITIQSYFESIVPDLLGMNAWRYFPQISPGLQEFVEAISLENYIRHQSLISLEDASKMLPPGVKLVGEDYILGIFDLSGELMRYAVTSMATTGKLPGSQSTEGEGRDMLVDLRQLRTKFEELDTTSCSGSWLGKEVEKKLTVMRESVQKVETAVCGLTIRGKERPAGRLLDSTDERQFDGDRF